MKISLRMLSILTLLMASTLNAQVAGKLNRIFIVDISGSMKGEKLETVKSEFLKVIEQYPPSVNSPVTLITFGSLTSPPIEMTDSEFAKKTIRELEANGGGTNIPKALFKLAAEIRRYPKSNVLAFMFSDGANGEDEAQMPKALAEVNGLFSQRKNKQLSNIVVLHQWGLPNQLNVDLNKMANAGSVTMLETKGFGVLTPRLTPKAILRNTNRHPKNPTQVQVLVDLSVGMIGSTPVPLSLSVTPKSRGQISFNPTTISANGTTKPVRLTLDVTPSEEKVGFIELGFSVADPSHQTNSGTMIVPQLATSKLLLKVPLPKRKFTRQVNIHYGPATKVAKWHNIELLQATYEVDTEFSIDSSEHDREGKSAYRIEGYGSTRILGGPKLVTIGPEEIKKLKFDVVTQSRSNNRADFEIQLNVVETNIPANIVSLTPQSLITIENLTPPPKLITKIEPVLLATKAPQWTSLSRGIATHKSRIEMRATGNVVASGQFKLNPILDAQANVASPNLTNRRTIVEANVNMTMTPSPNAKLVELNFVAPKSTPAVKYEMTGPISYSLEGPRQLKLRARTKSVIYVSNDQTHVEIPVVSEVVGKKHLVSDLVSLELESDQRNFKSDSIRGILGQLSLVNVNFNCLQNESFWLDSRKDGLVSVKPNRNTPLSTAQCSFSVVAPAPFKKILFGFIVLPCCVMTIAFFVWWGLKP